MASKETQRGSDARDTHNMSGSKIQFIDCKTELNSGKVKSLKCDFCKSLFCFKCTKLKQSIFNEIGREESILWTCIHCRIAAPGVNALKAQINNLEKKVADIEKMLTKPSTELPKSEKEVIREVIREEKEEENEREQRKLNIIVHALPESSEGTLEDRKLDDAERVHSILTDTLNVNIDIVHVIRLGNMSRERRNPRTIRFTVQTMSDKQRVLNASKALINNERFSNLYFSPDLTNGQRKAAFLLREERRRRIAAEEDNLVIRRGKIVERVARQESSDHSYAHERGRIPARGRREYSRSPPGGSQRGATFQ